MTKFKCNVNCIYNDLNETEWRLTS